jgi:hypothetical protein
MGVLDWLRKKPQDNILGSKILVCSLGNRFAELVQTDGEIWQRFYSSVTVRNFSAVGELEAAIGQHYDVVHLLCDVSPAGVVADSMGKSLSGTSLIEKCCDSDVKLLWIASDNTAEGYLNGFKARGKRINLVMTLQRRGDHLSRALEKLLSRMCVGEKMPVAWATLWPQVPGTEDPDALASIFFAGRGDVGLLR